MSNKGLVTVLVITYNSDKTIVDTLESIYRQTYENIEIVISDDCSSDETINLCNEWLEAHRARFFRDVILVNKVNVGVPANINRGVQASHGEFVKLIAGDDILLDNCILLNMNYMDLYPESMIVFSKCRMFSNIDNRIVMGDSLPTDSDIKKATSSTKDQLLYLYYYNFLPACTCFVKNSVYQRFCYQEKYRLFEDLPFYTILAQNNIHLCFMNELTVLYRVGDSLSLSKNFLVNENLHHYKKMWFYSEIAEELKYNYPNIYRYRQIKYLLEEIQLYLLSNKRNLINRLIVYLLEKYFQKDLKIM